MGQLPDTNLCISKFGSDYFCLTETLDLLRCCPDSGYTLFSFLSIKQGCRFLLAFLQYLNDAQIYI